MTVLLFISTIVIFLTIDYFIQRKRRAVPVLQTAGRRDSVFRIPAGIFFTRSHTWLSLFPSGKVQLGIDDFLSRLFNAPSITMLKRDGERIAKGEPILRLAEGNNSIVVRSPLDGTVESANTKLAKDTSPLSDALFSEGWAYTIRPSDADVLRSFSLGENTKVWLNGEMGRLRDFFAHQATPMPVFLQDGGAMSRGILNNLSTDQCRKFEQEFLSVE